MKVTLITDHDHAGVSYPAGTEIDVSEADAAFLLSINAIGVGVAEPVEAADENADEQQPLSVAEAARRAARG